MSMTAEPKHTLLQQRDSFELASLVSSSSNGGDDNTMSSRGSIDRLSNLDYEDHEQFNQQLSFDSLRRQSYGGSLFDYGDRLYPLAASADTGDGALPLEKQKRLGILNGLGLVIGVQIGSGIFSSPSQVDAQAGSPGASLLVWLVAGILAWTGAASYAELGTAIPLNGGAQAYLHHIFGPLPAFLFAWTAVTVLKPGSMAIIAIVFAEYIGRLIFSHGAPATTADSASAQEDEYSPVWFNKTVAVAGVLLVTILNAISTKLGTRTGDIFLFLKISSLVAITVIGLIVLVFHKGAGNFSDGWFAGSSSSLGSYAIALYAGLWAFDGWDNLNYVAAEMKNPSKDLPLVIHIAMPIVITCYLTANLAYYAVLPSLELQKSSTIALAFGERVFGRVGAIVFTVCVALSCFGALNAVAFTSARLVYVSGKDGFLPTRFGKVNKKTDTPINALLLQAAFTVVFVLVGEFKNLLTFYGVAGYLFYFLTVLGVIVLRAREPDLDRPYKTFILTPITFCCVALFLISRGVFSAPLEASFVALFVMAGVPIYYWRAGGGLYKMPVLGGFFRPTIQHNDGTTGYIGALN
ncbi:amino acid permease-domain-containing protein [Lipomyces tetrasporus]|uniref:Amino acid permease-domain-containing protein n=1 Tax=Lipomyces tetrasporus TaxID=54092 RepID=A0AAD7QVT8_9ASCO|nr:amino acid permease-domain-containing protein [Lipomyces tetrasporus]KAJ8100787.1 amino acid permease-domain-containing protein [Lipomyces tetrasporus]